MGKILILYKEYDKSSRLVRVSDSLGGEISYSYDELGQKIWEKWKVERSSLWI
ncbi:MAG: RHS repeat protein [Clostridiales bacterium]|nr:RHS repeat protein [Clostridiales bacterium]